MYNGLVWEADDSIFDGVRKALSDQVQAAVLDYFGNVHVALSEYQNGGWKRADKLSVYVSLPEPLDHFSKRVPISDLLEQFAEDYAYGADERFVDRAAEPFLAEIEAKIAAIRARYGPQK